MTVSGTDFPKLSGWAEGLESEALLTIQSSRLAAVPHCALLRRVEAADR